MKKMTKYTLVLLVAGMAIFSSCSKTEVVAPKTTATIIYNDSITVTPDSIHWDYYGGSTPRMQAFKNSVAIVTLWPTSINTGTYTLSKQYLYWIITNPTVYTVNGSGGSLTITNSLNVLSGNLTAMGSIWSGTGPNPTKISMTFANVKQLGM